MEAELFTEMQQTRRDWESLTMATRRIAIAADLELRRRHPRQQMPPLTPAAAEAASDPQHQRDARSQALGLTLDTADARIPDEVYRLRQAAVTKGAKIDGLRSVQVPAAEHDGMSPGSAWPEQVQRERAAVHQPAEQDMPASKQIAAEYEARRDAAEPEMEAG